MSDAPHYCILIYSKYSKLCENAIPLAKRAPQVKLLCADNKAVRERLKASKIAIKFIPTILLIFTNGTVEKYEGSQVIKILEHVVNTENPPVQPIKPKFLQPPKKQPIQEPEEEEEEEEIVVPVRKLKPKPIPKSKPKSKMRKQPVMPIEEEEEEENFEATPIEELIEEEEEEENETGLKFSDKLEKPMAKNDKRPMTNSMNIAQQIAKERDMEEQLIDSKKAKGRR